MRAHLPSCPRGRAGQLEQVPPDPSRWQRPSSSWVYAPRPDLRRRTSDRNCPQHTLGVEPGTRRDVGLDPDDRPGFTSFLTAVLWGFPGPRTCCRGRSSRSPTSPAAWPPANNGDTFAAPSRHRVFGVIVQVNEESVTGRQSSPAGTYAVMRQGFTHSGRRLRHRPTGTPLGTSGRLKRFETFRSFVASPTPGIRT